jgi:glycosyltransferase involved in cell wall biosynthesis
LPRQFLASPLKILVELRPALEGHAGIPQETRLLFRGLGQLAGMEVQGLIQSSDRFLAPGLPDRAKVAIDAASQIDCLSRVVVSIQPPVAPRRASLAGRIAGRLQRLATPAAQLLISSVLGFRHKLTWFDPTHFHDFVWRSLFAKSLPVKDFDQVTRATFRIARAPYGLMHACGLATLKLGRAIYPRLDTSGIDAMLVLTPYPATVTKGTKLVVRYFDAVPLLMPHTIINKAHHQALHYQSLRLNVANGAYFACCSEATRRDLLAVFPEVEARAVTIPCMVSHHYFPEESSPRRVPEILVRRRNATVHGAAVSHASLPMDCEAPVDYLLMVSTLEPRKNHAALVEAWEQLRSNAYPGLRLVFVGSLGWEHEAIVERMRPWVDRGEVFLLAGVPADELRLIYRHARATVCPSFSEGFGYAGIEAMRCGGVVAASDIPVHREIYDDAAEYFNPYESADIVRAVTCVIGVEQQERRNALLAAGIRVSERYIPECILPQWQGFLESLR